MGYKTPNIDSIAKDGMMFTDYYGEQSCTAGRSTFITGQSVLRTGLSKVGLPGADLGLQAEDATIAELLKPHGYMTGQFGKNHLGDKDEFLPTNHGFDEFFGNLYHLNAEEEPENVDYPKDPEFRKQFGLGVLLSPMRTVRLKIPVHSLVNVWKPLMKRRYQPRSILWIAQLRRRSHSSFGGTRLECTSVPC